MTTKKTGRRTRKRTAAPPRAKARPAKASPGAGPPPLEEALRSFERLAESLSFTHESFAQSLLHLPRPEEFEPLTVPLQKLAAAVPALLEALSGRGTGIVATPQEPSAPALALEEAAPALALVRDAVASARARVDRALSALPRAGEYEPVARQLRELATVSPSLMDWLREIPALTAPLTASIDELREALAELDVALGVLGAQRTAAEAAGLERVKVVIRG